MIKCEKGTPGYLREKLKIEILRTVVYFAIVIAVFLLGYSQTQEPADGGRRGGMPSRLQGVGGGHYADPL